MVDWLTLGDSLERARALSPDRVAVTCEERSLTYRDFQDMTVRLAAGLLSRGLTPGDRVALHMQNGIQLAVAYYACFTAGLVAVPINTRLRAPEIEFLLNNSGARIYVGHPEFRPEVASLQTACPRVEQYCFTGSNEFQDLQARTTERSGLPEVQPTDLAAIIYSSGTTARPKGVMHTHATLLGTAEIICRSLQEVNATSFLEPGATVLVMPPMTHVSGLSTLIPGIALAKTLVLLPRFDPDAALDTFAQHRCTLAVGLPLMYKLLVEAQLRKQRDLSSASYWIVAGDSTPMLLLETFERVCGKPLIECHAMTEALPNTWNHPGRIRRGSMGQPEPLVEILVVGEDALEVPLSEPGEMLVRSPAIMSGYWQDPEATAEVMKDGWLRTGDIVRKDADGYFWFLGRRVEIIKRGGAKISVVEVEAALLEHPEVVEAGVVGLPDEFYGERIAAFASTRSGSALTPGELIAFVRARLAEHKVPEKIEFIDTLPKSSMGKIQRRLLKEMALGRLADAGSAHQPPTPPHESSLTRSTRAV